MMIIKTVKAGLATNLVWVTFDNGSFLPLFIDDVVRLKLKSNLEISDDQYHQIIDYSLYFLLKNYALRQVAISPKIASVIKPKLKLRFVQYCHKYKLPLVSADSYIQRVVDFLEEKKLLDQDQYAKYLISHHQRHSRRYLIQLLSSHGLDPNIYLTSLASDLPKINRLLIKKNPTLTDLSCYKTKNKIMASIVRKGFALSDVKNAIGDFAKSLVK